MNFETVVFFVFLIMLMACGSAGMPRRVGPNVAALLMVLVLQLIGMFWAASCFPTGWLHYFMPMLVIFIAGCQLNEIITPLPEEMRREVMGRTSLVLAVPALVLCIIATPVAIQGLRDSYRMQRELDAQYATLQRQHAEMQVQARRTIAVTQEAVRAMDAVFADAVKARYGGQ